MRLPAAVLIAVITAAPAVAAPAVLGFEQRTIALAVHESASIGLFGATAAWPVDATIADASVQNGVLTVVSKAAGETNVIVMRAGRESTLHVVVRGGVSTTPPARSAESDSGHADLRYASSSRQVQANVAATHQTSSGRTEIRIDSVHTGKPHAAEARVAMPSASFRLFRGDRELTFLDRLVSQSPLTLDDTSVRGIHYLDDHWRLHAGYTAYATYQSLLIPIDRELVAGGGYALRVGDRSRWTPSIFAYRDRTGRKGGNVLSMLYEYRDGERLTSRAELGFSHGFGGALQLFGSGAHDQLRVDVRYRPEDFAIAGAGDTRGLIGDGEWNHNYGRGSAASVSASVSNYARIGQRAVAVSGGIEHQLTSRFALTAGVSWGDFNGATSVTVPLGVRFDTAHAGVSALYRYADNSMTNRGGHGFRVSGRVNAGHVRASAYFDRQPSAPTLSLILREEPQLGVALEELGISVTSPSDIARALRENATLINLGFIDGVTIDLTPVRSQFGFELAWAGSGAARPQLRGRFVRNVTESVARSTETKLATLTYSQRLSAESEIFAGYGYSRMRTNGTTAVNDGYFEVGIRHSFDGLGALLPSFGSISGTVFADEDLDGESDGHGVPDAVVTLDGAKVVRTSANGAFAFNGVSRGSHRVRVSMPSQPAAYFTTASQVDAQAGDKIAFGVASTPARLAGRVASDAGDGVAGVRVVLARGSSRLEAVTASNGSFSVAAPPGEWQLSVAADSIPAGYTLPDAATRGVVLARDTPANVELRVRANRSIAGHASPNATIVVESLHRRVTADRSGHFAIRSLPPGEIVLTTTGAHKRVILPREPATVTVDF